jgi:uncharacterized protein (DUF58 family)
VTRAATPKLSGYAALSAIGLLAALVSGRPELVALAAPFLLALAAGLVLSRAPRVTAEVEVGEERAIEGAAMDAVIRLSAAARVERLDVLLQLPRDVELIDGVDPVSLTLAPGEVRELPLRVELRRWGAQTLGPLLLRATDAVGLITWEGRAAEGAPPVRVYPREDALRRVLQPRETQLFAGNEVSRRKGEGIEFADLRPWAAGDALKRVNWRASARRGELWVNESHPERNTDVVLFVDSFAEARRGGSGTLELAVRATAALVDAYVGRRDRVGLVAYGGVLRWLVPGSGLVQLYRIVDALIDTEIVLSYYWRELDVIPRRTLPPNALVIALSPLLDERSVGALLDLRARGFDLVVLDVTPVPFTERPRGLDGVAFDIWTMRREALRHRLQEAGVAVAECPPDGRLQESLEEVRSFRRYARLARG